MSHDDAAKAWANNEIEKDIARGLIARGMEPAKAWERAAELLDPDSRPSKMISLTVPVRGLEYYTVIVPHDFDVTVESVRQLLYGGECEYLELEVEHIGEPSWNIDYLAVPIAQEGDDAPDR